MRFHHAEAEMGECGIAFNPLELGDRLRSIIHTVSAVDTDSDLFDAFTDGAFQSYKGTSSVESSHASITAWASSSAPSPPSSQWRETATLAPAASHNSRILAISAGVSLTNALMQTTGEMPERFTIPI